MANELTLYKEGDDVPELNKKVEMLIISTPEFYVFLDEEFYVQWMTKDGPVWSDGTDEVINRVSYLETISTTHFSGLPSEKRELAEFRRLLGEAVARALDANIDAAKDLLDKSETLLQERSTQRARAWYLTAAGLAACVPLVLAVVLWLSRAHFRVWLGNAGFDVTFGAALGGIGALVSTIFNVRKINLNASFGPALHYIEGIARVVTGTIGGALVCLAIKGNLLLGGFNAISEPTIRVACLFTLALLAGSSERIVPNFIKKMEKTTGESEQVPSADEKVPQEK